MSLSPTSRVGTPERRAVGAPRRSYINPTKRNISAERSRFCRGVGNEGGFREQLNGTTVHATELNGRSKCLTVTSQRNPALFASASTINNYSAPPFTPKQTDQFWNRMREENAQRAQMHKMLCESKGIPVGQKERSVSSPQRSSDASRSRPLRHLRASRCLSPEQMLRSVSLSLGRPRGSTPRRNTSSIMRAVGPRVSYRSNSGSSRAVPTTMACLVVRPTENTGRKARLNVIMGPQLPDSPSGRMMSKLSAPTSLCVVPGRGVSAREHSGSLSPHLKNCRTDTIPYIDLSGHDDLSSKFSSERMCSPPVISL